MKFKNLKISKEGKILAIWMIVVVMSFVIEALGQKMNISGFGIIVAILLSILIKQDLENLK